MEEQKNMIKIFCMKKLYVHHMHAWCMRRPEEDAGSPRAGVTDGSELLYQY